VRKPYYDNDLTGGTGLAPIRRKITISGFFGSEKPLYGAKIRGIGPYLGRLANSISETSSQLTPPSSGESRANQAALGSELTVQGE
jgi:hypothetical protein